MFFSPNVPKEYLLVKGAVILLSVLDYDHVGSDDFAGEIVMHLSSVSKINMSETVDSRPVVMMPVKRPSLPQQGPYQVIDVLYTGTYTIVTVHSLFFDWVP